MKRFGRTKTWAGTEITRIAVERYIGNIDHPLYMLTGTPSEVARAIRYLRSRYYVRRHMGDSQCIVVSSRA